MPLLFQDYTELVVKAYEDARVAGRLSPLLVQPTTVSIRQECMNMYSERLEKGERVETHTLQGFFRTLPEGKKFAGVIEACSPDRFRPLQGLMKREVGKPKLVNVELLAWLIDFKPRPFSKAQQELATITSPEPPLIDTVEEPGINPPLIPGAAMPVVPVLEPGKTLVEVGERIRKTKAAGLIQLLKKKNNLARNRVIKIVAAVVLVAGTAGGVKYILGRKTDSSNGSAKIMPAENRCKALTKSGSTCKRKANSSGYCWQHEG